MKKILILNGPNLNMLGTRQPEIYGSETMAEVESRCKKLAKQLDMDIEFYQSNYEGELVTYIQQARERFDGLVINAGGYTHTSVAIVDALILLDIPAIEVHISNIYKREAFRQKSMISSVVTGLICGFGTKGYELALKSFI